MSLHWHYVLLIVLPSVVGIIARCKHIPVLTTARLGAMEGLMTAWRLLPYFVLMLVTIGMLRASGLLTDCAQALALYLNHLSFPSEIVPLALIRPFSGGGANALFIDLIHEYGPDSTLVLIAGTIIGSTETTFYVLTVYFGSIRINKSRYAIPVGLFADLCGVIAAIYICRFIV